MDKLETLAAIALDLTAEISAEDRYDRLLEALHRAIPYDAATLLRVEKNRLIPLAARGLTPDAMGRVYERKDHPRLDIICNSSRPVLFSQDSSLPDPFDGMLAVDPKGLHHIHACLGCPLYVHDKLVGVLTADSLDPGAFNYLPEQYLHTIGLMAGAQMQVADLVKALEDKAKRQGQIASDLMHDVALQRGSDILGQSAVIRKLRQEIELVAKSDFTILVLGETGSGKELVARGIHRHSSRRDKAMLYLNCAALPDSLAESELFGHVKGAYTGAAGDRAGKFELADGGTLFLDEIGELSLEIQAKILRVIQEGEIQRIGSEKVLHADVRLIAATNRDLESEVRDGKFRADLFHRLNVYPIFVPPLRERKEDIAILAGFFIERGQKKLGLEKVRIAEEALALLSRYDWPGNVRELDNILSRAVLKASRTPGKDDLLQIRPEHLAGDLGSAIYVAPARLTEPAGAGQAISFREEVNSFQRKLITRALDHNSGNWAAAARELDMDRSNLHNLATRLGLRKKK
ncbi:nitric oxide reductase transcriptional regulator NorR [Desulforhopalus singaporensis]|uniref:Anaerobic nitric oxide reductase transcription regulator n=1 Tax=Desulforhopalus singaporensis TaxID=91360 RepID=A0A1H0T7U3_9BACT|nr:nitric oxide reductase transcriptional regulator NorR [Desulforhopalus singaporensis]SDP50089.1 anaerobic nitric oxide reductase transcription regulator [Desulforhopalus singaporensis]